jgi:hypothetical protein
MKKLKNLLLTGILMTCLLFSATAQTTADSSQVETIKRDSIKVSADFAIYSANYCRGANFGYGPSAQITLQAEYKGFYVGAWSAVTGNGSYNYGNNLDLFVGKKIGDVSISVHDFFFFNKDNQYNAFFKRTPGVDSLDGHYLETQVKYSRDKWYVMAAYNFYASQTTVFPSTVYIEGEYLVTERLSIAASFQTGASAVNFYGNEYNKGFGFNYIGFNFNKPIEVYKNFNPILRASLHINPNYQNISSSLRPAPFNCVVGFTF